jgi:hypothetical protein
MATGKKFVTMCASNPSEMGLRSIASALEEMYHAPNFLELDSLSAIAKLVEPEYQAKALGISANAILKRAMKHYTVVIEPKYGT